MFCITQCDSFNCARFKSNAKAKNARYQKLERFRTGFMTVAAGFNKMLTKICLNHQSLSESTTKYDKVPEFKLKHCQTRL